MKPKIESPVPGICDTCKYAITSDDSKLLATYLERQGRVIVCTERWCEKLDRPIHFRSPWYCKDREEVGC